MKELYLYLQMKLGLNWSLEGDGVEKLLDQKDQIHMIMHEKKLKVTYKLCFGEQ